MHIFHCCYPHLPLNQIDDSQLNQEGSLDQRKVEDQTGCCDWICHVIKDIFESIFSYFYGDFLKTQVDNPSVILVGMPPASPVQPKAQSLVVPPQPAPVLDQVGLGDEPEPLPAPVQKPKQAPNGVKASKPKKPKPTRNVTPKPTQDIQKVEEIAIPVLKPEIVVPVSLPELIALPMQASQFSPRDFILTFVKKFKDEKIVSERKRNSIILANYFYFKLETEMHILSDKYVTKILCELLKAQSDLLPDDISDEISGSLFIEFIVRNITIKDIDKIQKMINAIELGSNENTLMTDKISLYSAIISVMKKQIECEKLVYGILNKCYELMKGLIAEGAKFVEVGDPYVNPLDPRLIEDDEDDEDDIANLKAIVNKLTNEVGGEEEAPLELILRGIPDQRKEEYVALGIFQDQDEWTNNLPVNEKAQVLEKRNQFESQNQKEITTCKNRLEKHRENRLLQRSQLEEAKRKLEILEQEKMAELAIENQKAEKSHRECLVDLEERLALQRLREFNSMGADAFNSLLGWLNDTLKTKGESTFHQKLIESVKLVLGRFLSNENLEKTDLIAISKNYHELALKLRLPAFPELSDKEIRKKVIQFLAKIVGEDHQQEYGALDLFSRVQDSTNVAEVERLLSEALPLLSDTIHQEHPLFAMLKTQLVNIAKRYRDLIMSIPQAKRDKEQLNRIKTHYDELAKIFAIDPLIKTDLLFCSNFAKKYTAYQLIRDFNVDPKSSSFVRLYIAMLKEAAENIQTKMDANHPLYKDIKAEFSNLNGRCSDRTKMDLELINKIKPHYNNLARLLNEEIQNVIVEMDTEGDQDQVNSMNLANLSEILLQFEDAILMADENYQELGLSQPRLYIIGEQWNSFLNLLQGYDDKDRVAILLSYFKVDFGLKDLGKTGNNDLEKGKIILKELEEKKGYRLELFKRLQSAMFTDHANDIQIKIVEIIFN